MKAIYIDGTCEFCEYIMTYHPQCWVNGYSNYVKGRCYTIVCRKRYSISGIVGYGVKTAENPLPESIYSCSCQFREIDGDKDAFEKMMLKNRPKTKELEPA